MARSIVLPSDEGLLSPETKLELARYIERLRLTHARRSVPYRIQQLVVDHEYRVTRPNGSPYHCGDEDSDCMFGNDPDYKWVDEFAALAISGCRKVSHERSLPRLAMIWIAMQSDT